VRLRGAGSDSRNRPGGTPGKQIKHFLKRANPLKDGDARFRQDYDDRLGQDVTSRFSPVFGDVGWSGRQWYVNNIIDNTIE